MSSTRKVVAVLAVLLTTGTHTSLSQVAGGAMSQGDVQSQPAAPLYSMQEIEALLAPVALYPDTLLSQVLMASTYPLEVVSAARWSKSNGNKGGEAAIDLVQGQGWDPSVKSLVAFPNVLTMMNEQLDWTQKLGDAFLGQESEVIDAIQHLRHKAEQAGHLSSNEQQHVVTQGQTIIIEPSQPQMIYVPAYNPTVVYGGWAYPSYPPAYYPGVMSWYPGQALIGGLMFGTGVAVAGAMFGSFNWGNHGVNINVNNYRRYDRNGYGNGNNWQHNPQHRGAVAYRDPVTRQRYASNNGREAVAQGRSDMRGHVSTSNATRGSGIGTAVANNKGAASSADISSKLSAGNRTGNGTGNNANVSRQAVANQRSNGAGAAAGSGGLSNAQSKVSNADRSAIKERAQNTSRGDAFKGAGSASAPRQAERGRASSAAASNRSAATSRASSARAGGKGGGGGRSRN